MNRYPLARALFRFDELHQVFGIGLELADLIHHLTKEFTNVGLDIEEILVHVVVRHLVA